MYIYTQCPVLIRPNVNTDIGKNLLKTQLFAASVDIPALTCT